MWCRKCIRGIGGTDVGVVGVDDDDGVPVGWLEAMRWVRLTLLGEEDEVMAVEGENKEVVEGNEGEVINGVKEETVEGDKGKKAEDKEGGEN
jgi:hypothetical protein